ncbi:MAG TPA: hypothetical protein PKA88_39345 [Polyangiaceae bacterium]|nr:hypothetical protein [Polyangiaceae bacterium]HMR73603.1 hypothetical protein [Polyangiaceae bacterium]
MRSLFALSSITAALVLAMPRSACAHEVFLGVGPAVGFSTGNDWEGDGAIFYGQSRFGYRSNIPIGVVGHLREGYAKVDERLLTNLALGVEGRLPLESMTPWLRLSWLHQHEESIDFAKEEPFGVLFGVGRGIRHRGGVGFGAGVDVPFAKTGAFDWFAGGEAFLDYLFASEAPGPSVYAGGALSIGASHRW